MSQSCVWFFGLDPLWWYLVFPNPGVGLFCALLTCITPILIWRQHIWYCHSCTISLSWVYCHRCTISSFECIVWGSMIHGWHDSEVRTLHLSNCVSLLPHKDSFLTYLNSWISLLVVWLLQFTCSSRAGRQSCVQSDFVFESISGLLLTALHRCNGSFYYQ